MPYLGKDTRITEIFLLKVSATHKHAHSKYGCGVFHSVPAPSSTKAQIVTLRPPGVMLMGLISEAEARVLFVLPGGLVRVRHCNHRISGRHCLTRNIRGS